MAPTLEPTTMSAVTPCATSDCSMPTWIAPKLPPPARTNAVFNRLPLPPTESASTILPDPRLASFSHFRCHGHGRSSTISSGPALSEKRTRRSPNTPALCSKKSAPQPTHCVGPLLLHFLQMPAYHS